MIFKHPNGARWLIVLLVVLNLVTLCALFFSRGRKPERRPDTIGLFRRELGLNDEQTEQFRSLRKAHFEQTRPLFKELRAINQRMIESLGDQPADSMSMRGFNADRAVVFDRIDSLLARHYLDLRAVCTAEQQTKLESIFVQAMWPSRDRDKDKKRDKTNRQDD